MNYQFAPFRMGISDVTPEEMEAMKKKAKVVVDKMYGKAVFGYLVAAEISTRVAANVLSDSADMLKDAFHITNRLACEVADHHDAIEAEISLIEKDEVL